MRITATIITHNEAANIRAACESVAWADEVLVVDSESSDDTREIASAAGARVINRAWPGFADQKQFAATAATHDWIYSLDADERVSDRLAQTIQDLRGLDDSQRADGYRIARRAFYMNRWIRGGGWYPDYQLRLYRKAAGRWQGTHIHESVQLPGGAKIQKAEGDILHYVRGRIAYSHEIIGKRYAPLGARQMFEAGRRTSPLDIAIAGPATFVRNYVLKGGFRDGLPGFCIAAFAGYHAFLKRLLLWEMQQGGNGK
jgi:glycosyltransferase involved in cell wall biosynthesis